MWYKGYFIYEDFLGFIAINKAQNRVYRSRVAADVKYAIDNNFNLKRLQ